MNRFMMATKAMHRLGDVSSEEPDICHIYGEEGDDFIGMWVIGLGFVDVRFPKGMTRELTYAEREYYHGRFLDPVGILCLEEIRCNDCEEKFMKTFGLMMAVPPVI